MCKTSKLLLSGTVTLAVILSGGCKTAAPTPSGFLSNYSHLQKVDDSTWRYVDANRLGAYQKFTISPVSVMVQEYWGTTFSADQRQAIGAMFHQKIVSALSGHYEVVSTPGANTPDVRVAITQAYRIGNSLALGVEAEIIDPQTHQQLAAIRGIRVGPPEMGFRLGYHNPDASGYMASWWTWPSAVELMDQWAGQIQNLIEEAHKR